MTKTWALITVIISLVGCNKGASEAEQNPPAEAANAAVPASEKAQPKPQMAPEGKPCRVEKRYRNGDLSNWWSLKYDGSGRLVEARDEQESSRRSAAKIKPREQVDAEFDKEPFQISYEYDQKGRLVRWHDTSDGERPRTITFKYGAGGKLLSYTTGEGPCSVRSRADGRPKSASCRMKMLGGKKVEEHLDGKLVTGKDSPTPPVVFADGNVWLGEAKKFIRFPGRSEVPMWTVWTRRGGALSAIQTMSMDGSKAQKYTFRYECSKAPK